MEHTAVITPLNCAYSTGLNMMLTMEKSIYDASNDRYVYCKDVDTSWFKMKSKTATPFLEPAFYGLNKGDIVTVEFEALLLSGDGGINFNFVKVNPDFTTLDLGGKSIPIGSLKSFYKRFKMSQIIEHDGIGTIINLRPNGTNHEMIIKNFTVHIETTNPLFSIANNVVDFRTRTDYMKCIDFYSGTNINTAYRGLLTLYNEGKISFPDDSTLKFTNAGTTLFKGLMSMFNGHKYRPSFVVYTEYLSPVAVGITSKAVMEDGTFIQDGTSSMPANSVMTKKILYFNGGSTPSRKSIVDIGMVGMGGDLTLKNVRISMPQFDDSVKREPNRLDELYTNLSTKLR